MTTQNFNIVSAKSLEKQLKVVETRIQELQTEIQDLEKIRSACHTLLGTSVEAVSETAEPAQELKRKPTKRAASPMEEAEEDVSHQEIKAEESAAPSLN